MNYNDYIVFDLETTGRDPNTCECIQVAALHLHPRRLVFGDTFNSLLRPLEPDKIEEEALRVNKKTREELAAAPHPADVWKQFTSFVQRYNYKGTPFTAPVPCGYNIVGFDMVIVQRMCEKYGPINEKTGKQALFSNFMQLDVMIDVFRWFENRKDLPNMKLDTLRDYMGLSKEHAHDALQDVRDTAKILVKYLGLYRNLTHKIPFKDCFSVESATV